jgi:ABC-type Fe3+-hydroxamate transport system substrate-binding protein
MATRIFTDMIGQKVVLNYPPGRIISLVPSQTELLYDLGLEDEVIGITKFCIHPEKWFRSKIRIGGTKTVHIRQIDNLQPDLIIANKEENTKEQIEELAAKYPVWVSNIQSIEDALQMIKAVGSLTDRDVTADDLVAQIASGFAGFQKIAVPKKVAYFIWRNPWMCAGGDTFINNMLEKAGWTNVMAHKDRYPAIDLAELAALQPQLILLSSEPYPFKDQHIAEIKTALPDAEVQLVDGEMFSWYGSRMLKAIPYLRGLAGNISV